MSERNDGWIDYACMAYWTAVLLFASVKGAHVVAVAALGVVIGFAFRARAFR